MIEGLLDTNILIDLLRGFVPARSWLATNHTMSFAIPSVVWMETIYGAKNSVEQKIALNLLSNFQVISFIEIDNEWAMKWLAMLHLSHNIGIIDVQIAAIAARTQLPLYTRNIKHFSLFNDIQIVVPY